jgi:hypothetical protein
MTNEQHEEDQGTEGASSIGASDGTGNGSALVSARAPCEDKEEKPTYQLGVLVICPACNSRNAIAHPGAVDDAIKRKPIGFQCSRCQVGSVFAPASVAPVNRILGADGQPISTTRESIKTFGR